MLLSTLIYECVRDSIGIPGDTMTEDDFIADFSGKARTKNYSMQISVLFSALNKALSRLYDSEKIQPFVKNFEVEGGYIDLSGENGGQVDVLNVAVGNNGLAYRNIPFRLYNDKLFLVADGVSPAPKEGVATVEYRKRLPHWDRDVVETTDSDADSVTERAATAKAKSIDLWGDYHIPDRACDYIKEYVESVVVEPMAPDVASLHWQRAESYFSALKDYSDPGFRQTVANNVFGGLFR